MTSCEKEFSEVTPVNPESSLTVTTRSESGAEEVAYPVAVYLFDANKACIDFRRIESADASVVYDLVEGVYDVYAFGGVAEGKYTLPSVKEATLESVITLQDGQEHGDLMRANSSVTTTKGEANTINLSMNRCVSKIESIVIKQVPDDVTAVSVTLSKTYKSMAFDGTMKDVNIEVITLEKSGTESGTWELKTPRHVLFDVAASASVKISMTTNGNAKGYTYQLTDKWKSNYLYHINATYTEKQNFHVTGTITGATWQGTEDIVFNFDETNTQDGGSGPTINETAPEVGTLYKGCYVLSRTEESNAIKVLLLHPNQYSDVCNGTMSQEEARNSINSKLSEIASVNKITGWHLPNEAEMDAVYSIGFGAINQKIPEPKLLTDDYFYDDNGTIRGYLLSSKVKRDLRLTTNKAILRPVAVVRFTK
ncbi:MAG: hypothetical protein SO375_03595 [Prevotella sp.]|nr:hypothetical protein [Prevotella sp.]